MNEKVDIPIVSVVMITYNHEAYIEEAINGVLMQECDFSVELIIADDCSPDNTESIVRNIIQTHPNGDWIKYTRHKENKGMMPNFIWALQQAQGKYIALCEGDDYWTDPLKLQKQVEFLRKNLDYIMVIHNVYKINYDHSKTKLNDNLKDTKIDFQRLMDFDIGIATCSWMFRRIINFPNWISNLKVGDWPILFTLINKGNCFYSADIMGVYRKHTGGATYLINKKNYYKLHIESLKKFQKNEDVNYKSHLRKGLSKLYFNSFLLERKFNRISIDQLILSIFYNPYVIIRNFKPLVYWISPLLVRKIYSNILKKYLIKF